MTPGAMRLIAGPLSWMAFLAPPIATHAGSESHTAKGEERAAILDVLRTPIAAELKQPFEFLPRKLRVCKDGKTVWAFVDSRVQRSGVGEVDWEAADFVDCSHSVDGLLKQTGTGAWTVVASDVCPTDVPWAACTDEFGAPAELFE